MEPAGIKCLFMIISIPQVHSEFILTEEVLSFGRRNTENLPSSNPVLLYSLVGRLGT